jgi:predicted permease
MRSALRQFMSRLFPSFRRRWSDADLGEEIHAHLDLLADEHVRRGMSREAARALARRDFGGVDQIKEQYRDQRALPFFDALAQDLRYAARTFRKSPGFVTAVVLSLAIGIGATSVVFTALNALMLMSLPVENAARLFHLTAQTTNTAAAVAPARFSYEAFTEFRRAAPVPQTVAAMSRVARMYRREEDRREPVPTTVQLVSGEYFPVLGVTAFLGRTLEPADNQTPGAHPVAVMSHAMWTRTFGADPHVVGRTLTVNGRSLTIVGVAPAGFSGVWLESPVDLWVPLMMQQDVRYRQNYSASDARPLEPWIPQDGIRWLDVIGRQDETGRMATALKSSYEHRLDERVSDPATRERLRRQGIRLQPFSQGFSNLRGNFGPALYALFGMASVILLVACANAANLLLARAASRRREFAIRLSMGAGRSRVVRQLLTESALLAAVSCGLGLLVAGWAANLLVRSALGGAARFGVHVDMRVVLFAVGAALLTVVLTGLAPALRSTGAPAGLALYVVSGASARVVPAQPRLQKLLVAAQVALSLVLVVAAGLFVQTLRNYSRVNLGFSQEHVVTVPLNLTSTGYPRERLGELSRALVERLETVPGVTSASTAMCALVDGCRSTSDVVVEGYRSTPGEIMQVQENRVSLEYFTTTGMRIVEGRGFDAGDRENTRLVAVVNRSMARRFFGDRSPIGKRFGYAQPDIEIVGVVDDARVNRVQQAPSPMAFYPMTQNPELQVVDVRTAGNPRDALNDVRRAIASVLPDAPLGGMLLSDQVSNNLNQERLIAALTSIFGVLALALASLGLFGVMSYAVAQRTPEFGIRMALGASRTHVLATVVRESLMVVGIGAAIGVVAVFAAARLLVALLFGISGTDLSTLGAALVVLTTIAGLASAAPAWRAARVDPMVALRHE